MRLEVEQKRENIAGASYNIKMYGSGGKKNGFVFSLFHLSAFAVNADRTSLVSSV